MNMELFRSEAPAKERYLIFRMGTASYGTPLLSVREVIENRPAQPVPNSAPAFQGVINLRGEVVGIVDLRKVMGIVPAESLAILIFEAEGATLGVIVDRCLAVSEIKTAEIDQKAGGEGSSQHPHFVGVGKINDQLVTLLDLSKVPGLLSVAPKD